MDAQPISANASSGKAGFKVILGRFVDRALLGDDAIGSLAVGGAGSSGGRTDVRDGGRGYSLLLAVELLEVAALRLPMAGLGPLKNQQKREASRDGDPRMP